MSTRQSKLADAICEEVVTWTFPTFIDIPDDVVIKSFAARISNCLSMRLGQKMGMTVVGNRLCIYVRAAPYEFRKPSKKKRTLEVEEI